jgi:amino acid transporter
MSGVLKGVSSVFFAYIGFDALATTAEECKEPQKDLPKSMINSLLICTVLYILIALVLTGMVSYTELAVGDPLAFVFEKVNLGWMSGIVAVSAVIAMASVLLVFQNGQPRIWMTMSRDGLLPERFSRIHPKFKTPAFSTIITGLVVGLPILFTDKTFVLDFTSIATLFAFVLVCGGVLLLPKKEKEKGKFHLTYINAKLIFPLIIFSAMFLIHWLVPNYFIGLFNINGTEAELTFNISSIIFWIICIVLALGAFLRNWSLIPLLGLVTCLYLLTGMTAMNWAWFAGWLLVGLIIYFSYSIRNSRLSKA